MTTSVHLLTAGYAHDRVASSVTLVIDGDALIVADPGMVARRSRILAGMRGIRACRWQLRRHRLARRRRGPRPGKAGTRFGSGRLGLAPFSAAEREPAATRAGSPG